MKSGPARPPTMKDVAKVAGVGLKTVSRYVNGETNINPELSQRIQEAIEQLGYTRNLAAASIRPGWSSKMIGLVISDMADPFYSGIASAIEKELASEDFILILAHSFDRGESMDEVLKRLIEQRVEGLILVPPHTPSQILADPARLGVPTVLLDRPTPAGSLDVVMADNFEGARQAGMLLRENGFSKPSFLGDSLTIYTMRERYRGLCAAFDLDSTDSQPLPGWFQAHTKQQATEGAKQLLNEGDIDCIFAANNRATTGTLSAFQETDRWLPIVGFDDFENASLIMGGLTVVAQDVNGIGSTAAQLLLQRIRGEAPDTREVVLDVELIRRGSERPDWQVD